MARGRGGRGGGSSASCPYAFRSVASQVFFANDVIFFVVFLGIFAAFFTLRKKCGAGKKLIGVPFVVAIFFTLLQLLLSFIARVLQECDTISYYDWYDWQIPITIFGHLGLWALLFVVAYTLNAMLRGQLGRFTAVFKIACLAIVGIMGAMTCAWVGVASYNYWTQTKAGFRQDAEPMYDVHQSLVVAYYALYMVSVLGAGAIALMSILSLRSRKHPAGDLIGWVVALIFSMFLWVVFLLAGNATVLSGDFLELETSAALSYLSNFFLALSCIFLICIAKHVSWNTPAAINDAPMHPDPHAPAMNQQQYAYNGQADGQMHYYQQPPGYNNAPELAK